MARSNRSNRNGAATATADEQAPHPKVGEESVTTEGSHRSVSMGDGTAIHHPIVNGNGEYPPRPEESEE